MKVAREKRGQFVIIAVLLTAIMIVSIGALMHTAITYYKHEPWEEYSTLIGDIELNSRRLLELSLANYTNSVEPDSNILVNNLEKWQNDLAYIYPARGIVLKSDISLLPDISSWNKTISWSETKADFTLDIKSIGLTGYKFAIAISLSLKIKSVTTYNETHNEIIAAVKSESGNPVPNLNKNNFRIDNTAVAAVSPSYDEVDILVYRIVYEGSLSPLLEVWDRRGIRVVGLQN